MRKKNNEVYDRNDNGLRRLCGILQYNIYKHGQMNATYEADYIIVLGSKVNGTKHRTHCNIVLIKQLSILHMRKQLLLCLEEKEKGRYFRSISNEK